MGPVWVGGGGAQAHHTRTHPHPHTPTHTHLERKQRVWADDIVAELDLAQLAGHGYTVPVCVGVGTGVGGGCGRSNVVQVVVVAPTVRWIAAHQHMPHTPSICNILRQKVA